MQAPSDETAKERLDRRERNELLEVINTDAGRALVWRILGHCHPLDANKGDNEFRRGIAEGERRIGIWLTEVIENADVAGMAKLMVDAGVRAGQIEQQELAIEYNRKQAEEAAKAKMGQWERAKRYILGDSLRKS